MRSLIVFAGLSFVISAPASAALISASDPVFGADSITRDTETNLEWLDVPLSLNLSYADVSSEFGAGGDFEGFRYGTQAEVDLLFRHAGFAVTDGVRRVADYPVAIAFHDLLGITSSTARGDAVLGITGDPVIVGPFVSRRVLIVGFEVPPFTSPAAGSAIGLDSAGVSLVLDTQAADFRGSWLVRSTVSAVPEPGSLTLAGMGIVGLAAGAYRRRWRCLTTAA